MSDCRFGVSPVNYPDPDPDPDPNHPRNYISIVALIRKILTENGKATSSSLSHEVITMQKLTTRT